MAEVHDLIAAKGKKAALEAGWPLIWCIPPASILPMRRWGLALLIAVGHRSAFLSADQLTTPSGVSQANE